MLNDGDPTPTIRPYTEYPEWLLKLADTPETLAALSKDYKKHNAAQESETVDETVLMDYERIMRLNKLENRQLIKVNHTHNTHTMLIMPMRRDSSNYKHDDV